MATYAALISLMNTLNNIQVHPQVSTFFYHNQIQSLHEIINFLLDFIESSRADEVLERRIASTTHAAEDVIESHVVDQILTGSSDLIDLETEIEAMNYVKEAVMEFGGTTELKDQESSDPVLAASSRPTTTKMTFMVGFDEKVIQIMDRLTGHESDLRIVPIVGMGGIGKTTLAKSVYDNLLTVESFDIRAWVTISQEYSVKYVLSELLSCIKDPKINKSIGAFDREMNSENIEDHQLGLKLYQILSGRRYLIVLDDMWSVKAWDKIKVFFPDNGHRSRVVITTRISSVATYLSSSSFEMNFLDEDQSWQLFCENVFLGKDCPPELEEIGKEIVRECKGLPLSITVIGGLLRNSRNTREYWEDFARDLNSILMSENDGHCLNILSLSYNHLPTHLKPCFLYMGVFREDVKIHVTRLINLFVAEGFLKSKEGKTMEETALDYLNDLVDRNLILVDSWKWNGRIKCCKIHDLVREVCLKIGVREKIFHGIRKLRIPADINIERRIVFDGKIPKKKKNWPKVFHDPPSASLARTFLYDGGPLPFKFRLLRVLDWVEFVCLEDIFELVNLRYLNWSSRRLNLYSRLPSSVSLLWNVHTLIFMDIFEPMYAPPEIWYMRQLRHVQFYRVILPHPPPIEKVEQQDDVFLPNLHTLSEVLNCNFTEEVCMRIPNIKKLGIVYTDSFVEECREKCHYYLNQLHELQSFYCCFDVPKRAEFLQSLVFPSSLKKLSFRKCYIDWENLNAFGLSLPHLQVLKLSSAVRGPEWDCVEGAFPRLKFLEIEYGDLVNWTAESSDCFPVLENLLLRNLPYLERIPSCIGDIQTLEYIHVYLSSVSAAVSSTEILEEQLSLGNEDLLLEVTLGNYRPWHQSFVEEVDIESFTSKNFKFYSDFN